jgi:hypothetical protein
MKAAKLVTTLGTIALVLSMVMLYTGCEDEPKQNDMDAYFAANPFSIDPRIEGGPLDITIEIPGSTSDNVIFHMNQVIPLRAKGGSSGYTWFVATAAAGSVAPIADVGVSDSANYTVLGISDNTVYVLDGHGRAGSLTMFVGTGSDDVEIVQGTSIPLAVGATAILTAAGGVPPYTWTATTAVGTMGGVDGNEYTAGVSGTNTVTVVGTAGTSDIITITHP